MSRPFAPSGSRVPYVATLAAGVEPDDVVGQVDRLAGSPSSRRHVVDLVALAQRVADRVALRGEEREAHAAADDERVDDVEQGVDHAELVGHLGAAEHGDERPLRVARAGPSSTSTSFASSRPAAEGSVRGGPTIEAWARCEAPNASFT